MKHAPHPTGLPFKPEQTFFKDPATDRLLAMVMTLAADRQAFAQELMLQTLGVEVSLGAPAEGVDKFDRN